MISELFIKQKFSLRFVSLITEQTLDSIFYTAAECMVGMFGFFKLRRIFSLKAVSVLNRMRLHNFCGSHGSYLSWAKAAENFALLAILHCFKGFGTFFASGHNLLCKIEQS